MTDLLRFPPDGPPDARLLALKVLTDGRSAPAYAGELLDEAFRQHDMPASERRLATQLTLGVLRRRGTLDALVTPFVNRPPHRVEPWVRDTLHLGAYQLALLTHVPAHAALNETVELASRVGLPRAKGFLNAVLRRVAELVTARTADVPAADALPTEGGKYRGLNQPVLPDPAADPAAYLAAGFSWPNWLAGRWLERFGFDECVRLGFWLAGPAPLWLRVNRLQMERADYLLALAQARIDAEPQGHPQAVRLIDHLPIRELPGYDAGWFAVQDVSAMKVASAVNPAPGATVLDLCAAPGGKTTHLAELMQNRGRIVACDVDERRLSTLRDLAGRLGISIIEPHWLRERGDPPGGPYDAALVDVPCSNTGVLGRRPEARWRLSPNDFKELVPTQVRLLLTAADQVRPGGVLVYSTCSIEPEENQQVVRTALRGLKEFSLEAEEQQSPGQPGDGGYWARLRRNG